MTKKGVHEENNHDNDQGNAAESAENQSGHGKRSNHEHDKKMKELEKKCYELEAKVEGLESDKKNYQDKLARVMADFDNHRRRTEEERSRIIKQAAEKIILEMLPVLDDMTRALDTYDENHAVDKLIDGLKLVGKKFSDVMAFNGVAPIDALNKPFDPYYHEALTMVVEGEHEHEEQVVQEYRKGYMLYDKVIRPSQVVVSKKKENDSGSTGEENKGE